MLLERESELDALFALVGQLDESGGKVVLIRGEAGIGKSALVNEMMARLEDRAHILLGACDDLLTPQTLGAFWDMAHSDASISEGLVADDRRRVQQDVLGLLSRALRPTIVVIEDTQWADEATLDVIKYLGRRVARTNGLMVLTYRDQEIEPDHPLRQVIGDLPPTNVIRLQLEALTAEAVKTMIGASGLDVSDVLAQTDGNPLYVSELVAWGTGDVPASIQEMVQARVAKASPTARDLLDVVSVIPGDAERHIVEAIADTATEGLGECEQIGLLRSTTLSVSYVHELQRRAVETSLRPQRRQDLNTRVMAELGAGADPARLVHHAREAHDTQAVIAYAPLAAHSAVATGSARDAVSYFRVLDPHIATMDPDEAAGILDEWARQEFYLHHSAALDIADRAISAHRSSGNETDLGRSLAFSARINMQHFRTETALARATEAVEILEYGSDRAALAYALSTLAYVTWLYDEDVPASLEVAERALAVARASGDRSALQRALAVMGNIEYSVGIDGGMQRLEQAWALAAEIGDRDAEVRALSNMTAMSADFRNMTIATDLARRAIETAARFEMRAIEAETNAMYAEILLWLGRWPEVEDIAADALGTQPSAETIAWRVLGTLQARRGATEARTALERMWSLARDAGQLTVVDPAAGALAEYMWLSDDHDPEWFSRLDAILAEGISVGNPWPSGALALWMWKLGRLDSAPEGTLDMYGWIIDGDLDPAIEFWSERGVPYEHAVALMHGTPEQQTEALRIAEDLGADALAGKIRSQLSAHGHTPPRGKARSTREHAAGLTTRQAEVLDLLAEGLSNIEIADRLFLSPRTVENHVAAILMKLDASTRDTAVARAREQAIL